MDKENICNASITEHYNKVTVQEIQAIHKYHFDMNKTLFFVKQNFPNHLVELTDLKNVVENCEEC